MNYENPEMSMKIEIQCILEGLVLVSIFAYFFYRSLYAFLLLLPGIWLYRKEKVKGVQKKRKQKLEEEFKDTMLAVQTNLQSGYSMENAILESYHYVIGIYGDSCDMAKELLWIKKGMANGDTLERLLLDLGKRCPESAIEDFAYIYSVASRTGGNWNEMITKTVADISQKIEIKKELDIMIHGKKVESRVMCVIPFFILVYMDITSKGYFDVLYHNIIGICIMTLCLAAYLFAFFWAERMTDIV